jgi:hypothetical protein
MARKIITLKRDGRIQMIHDDTLAGIYRHGPTTIKRASHVEPGDASRGQDPTLWYADMSPSGGPILPPHPTRSAALAAEVVWLNENVLTTGVSTV